MMRSFLLSAARNLLRHKVQSLINIASLAIGLTIFGFAFLYVKSELNYDHSWPEAERVHRLTIERRGLPGISEGITTSVPATEWTRLADYFGADIEASARRTSTVVLLDGDEPQRTEISLVDAQYFDIFQVRTLEGDLGRVLSGPGFVAVDERSAAMLGLMDRVGQRISMKSFFDQTQTVEYELAAIYRLPQPTSIGGGLITLMHEYSLPLFTQPGQRPYLPWEGAAPLWVKLRSGLTSAEFNAQQPAFVDQLDTYASALGEATRTSDHVLYRWQSLTELHFHPLGFEASAGQAGDYGRVATFAVVGLLVLLVGCSNSISLSLAAAIERRREIGVRKTAGALPRDILRQQLGESILLVLVALVPTIAALELLAPAFRTMLPFTAQAAAGPQEFLMLTLIALGVGLACGAYPALVLSATRPQAVLRAGAPSGMKGSLSLRGLLVALQFCFASMLLIGTAALYLQLTIARAQPLGFDADNIVLTLESEGVSADVMRAEFEKIPGVERVIIGGNLPNAGIPPDMNSMGLVRLAGDSSEVKAYVNGAGAGFFDMLQMQLLAGRDFDLRFDLFNQQTASYADGSTNADGMRIVINAAAARALGFASPEEAAGQIVFRRALAQGAVTHQPVRILGVIEDNQYASLRRRPGPELYLLVVSGERPSNLMVKFDEAVAATISVSLQETAQRVNGQPLNALYFAKPLLDAAFVQEQNESKLLLICGALALVLASFGLYGLAAFTLERQVKEVGVRKVMGAGVAEIVRLYVWRFARPIVLANLLAWPVATYFVLQWIQRFPYQIERVLIAPLCVLTLVAVLLIATLTVVGIITRAARAHPVRSLRYE